MTKTDKSKIMPALYSQPVIERLELPPRVDVLPKIENGEIEYLDFRANVFTNGLNRNPYRFRDEELAAFAVSFEGQPFLRDHETSEIDSRDGTILSSYYNGQAFVQDIRLTTRRGMLDFVEGRIDRFSIGWFYDDCICSICNSTYFSPTCNHWAGAKYQTAEGEKTCELIFVNPVGKETSAVNVPAVEGTGITARLSEYKREYLGMESAELNQSDENNDRQEPVTENAPAELTAQERASRSRQRVILIAKNNIIDYGGNPMKVRELLKARAALVEEAEKLTSLADAETRDLTEDERARFTAILGDEGEVAKLTAQITTIQDERSRLQAAQDAKFETGEIEKPQAPAPAAKTSIKREEYEALNHVEKAAWIKAGNKIED